MSELEYISGMKAGPVKKLYDVVEDKNSEFLTPLIR